MLNALLGVYFSISRGSIFFDVSGPRTERTQNGVSDTAKEKPREGEVIAIGPGGRDESERLTPLDLKGGDRVLFDKWSSAEVKVDGEDLLIMKESDIMGVVG